MEVCHVIDAYDRNNVSRFHFFGGCRSGAVNDGGNIAPGRPVPLPCGDQPHEMHAGCVAKAEQYYRTTLGGQFHPRLRRRGAA